MEKLCVTAFRRFVSLTALVVLGVLSFGTPPVAGADLRWLPSASPSVVGYKLHAGSESGFYSAGQIDRTIDIGSDYVLNEAVASRPLEDLLSDASWIVLTAYDATGRESPPEYEADRSAAKNRCCVD